MSRSCPRCDSNLTPRTSQGIEVDLCEECGGVFLDPTEFDDLIAERFEGKRLESTFAFTAISKDDPIDCPACQAAMQVVDHDGLEIDRCPECEGIWLDGEERTAFAERAKEREQGAPDVYLDCAGCGRNVPQRTCIRRLSQWWCEACVVEGNHPGPEAQLVGHNDRAMAAAVMFAKAKVKQAETKHRQAEAREMASEYSALRYKGRRVRRGMLGAKLGQWLQDLFN